MKLSIAPLAVLACLTLAPSAHAKRAPDCSGYTVELNAPKGDRPFPGMAKTCAAAKSDALEVCRGNPPADCAHGAYTACEFHQNLDGDECGVEDQASVDGAIQEAAAGKQWHRVCDGISDRGISNQRYSSLAACQRAAKRACSTLDGRVVMDADCDEVSDE